MTSLSIIIMIIERAVRLHLQLQHCSYAVVYQLSFTNCIATASASMQFAMHTKAIA
jgi:hypothetical protein